MHRIKLTDHLILILGVLFLLLPIWVVFASSTHRPETILGSGLQFWIGDYFWETYSAVLFDNAAVEREVKAGVIGRIPAQANTRAQIVAVFFIDIGGGVVDAAIAFFFQQGDAKGQFIVEQRAGCGQACAPQVSVAQQNIAVKTVVVLRLCGAKVDCASGRVFTKQGALGTAQHFNGGQIDQALGNVRGSTVKHLVYQYRNGLFKAAVVAGAEPTNIYAGEGGDGQNVEIGHIGGNFVHIPHIQIDNLLATDGSD